MWNSHSEDGLEMYKPPQGLVSVEQLLAKGNVPHRRRGTFPRSPMFRVDAAEHLEEDVEQSQVRWSGSL